VTTAPPTALIPRARQNIFSSIVDLSDRDASAQLV
jgi:hypothetical protein